MPQIRVSKPEKKKEKPEDSNRVVSAYSEEGVARIKKSKIIDRRLRIAAVIVLILGIIAVLTVITLNAFLHWF